jgi:dimethylhistidine N-methyltransferase
MDTTLTPITDRFALYRDPHPARIATFGEDARAGLTAPRKKLSPMYLYDDLGSSLFEAITRLPEYYLTRVERDLLATYAREIVDRLGGPLELLELGSGSALKTRVVIEAILERQPRLRFMPVDISSEALTDSSLALIDAHPQLSVHGYASDYFSLLRNVRFPTSDRILALYLGSNIGNFEPAQARDLLHSLARALKPGDALLLGFDLKKDTSILELAYDDPTGVTAAFNKNLLGRMNRELDANFDLHAFDFVVHYDEARGAVDSFLRSKRAQTVVLRGIDCTVDFAEGETIHTESSYKFSRDDAQALARETGWKMTQSWTDAGQRYALSLLEVR